MFTIFRYCVSMNKFKGFTLIETLIVSVILCVFIYAVYLFLFSTTQGARQGQEATDHIRTAGILFRSLELDLRGIIPNPVNSSLPLVQKSMSLQNEVEMHFFTIANMKDNYKEVRYSFDKRKHEVRREEKGDGQDRTICFGTNIIDDFTIQVDDNADICMVDIVLGIVQKKDGKKIKDSRFRRFFSRGFDTASSTYSWKFHPELFKR